MRKPVEGEIGDAEHRLLRTAFRPAAGQRLHARQELGKGIGLGEIIVAAGAKALHAVVDLTERGEDENGRLVILARSEPTRVSPSIFGSIRSTMATS